MPVSYAVGRRLNSSGNCVCPSVVCHAGIVETAARIVKLYLVVIVVFVIV